MRETDGDKEPILIRFYFSQNAAFGALHRLRVTSGRGSTRLELTPESWKWIDQCKGLKAYCEAEREMFDLQHRDKFRAM